MEFNVRKIANLARCLYAFAEQMVRAKSAKRASSGKLSENARFVFYFFLLVFFFVSLLAALVVPLFLAAFFFLPKMASYPSEHFWLSDNPTRMILTDSPPLDGWLVLYFALDWSLV